jgi:hypothetical protein
VSGTLKTVDRNLQNEIEWEYRRSYGSSEALQQQRIICIQFYIKGELK